MKSTKISLVVLIALMSGAFTIETTGQFGGSSPWITYSRGIAYKLGNKSVNIGTTEFPEYKLYVKSTVNADRRNTLGLMNDMSFAGEKIGFHNILKHGTGSNFGIKNEVSGANSNNKPQYGFYNQLTGGHDENYGIYNDLNGANSNNDQYGIYSLTNGGQGTNYGFYSELNGTNANKTQYGISSFVYGGNQANFGIKSHLVGSNGTKSQTGLDVSVVGGKASNTGIRSILANYGTKPIGIQNVVSDVSGLGKEAYGIHNFLYAGNSGGTKYGIYSELRGNDDLGILYGIFSEVIGGQEAWAGYFKGRGYFGSSLAIGTESPGANMLAVKGNAAIDGKLDAEKIEVKNLNLPDYVFKKEYNLRSVEEVEDYIQKNGHLPDLPSADEIAKNGMDLTEMNNNLLRKIEELTLYVIQQNKQIKELQRKARNRNR